ncbi:hypothetical protein Tco_1547820 [Tanacetum coccineum]
MVMASHVIGDAVVKVGLGFANHVIRECPKPPKDKNQRAFVRGSWSDSGEEDDEKVKNETCLIAQASSELKEEALKLTKFEKSTHCLNEMLNNQKPSGEKLGLGFNLFEASSSGTKEIIFVKAHKKVFSDGGTINMGGPLSVQAPPKANTGPPLELRMDLRKICLGVDLEPKEWIKDSGCSKHMMGNRKLLSSYKEYSRGNVIFGSNLCGNIIGKGQICDNKYRVTFSEHDSEITDECRVVVDTPDKELINTRSCDELAQIRRIFLVGYGVLMQF